MKQFNFRQRFSYSVIQREGVIDGFVMAENESQAHQKINELKSLKQPKDCNEHSIDWFDDETLDEEYGKYEYHGNLMIIEGK